jgi:hypothetical protein
MITCNHIFPENFTHSLKINIHDLYNNNDFVYKERTAFVSQHFISFGSVSSLNRIYPQYTFRDIVNLVISNCNQSPLIMS